MLTDTIGVPYIGVVITLRIKELREARGWSQAELARQAGVRQATLSAIENQQTTAIDFMVLERLARALDVPAALLLHESKR